MSAESAQGYRLIIAARAILPNLLRIEVRAAEPPILCFKKPLEQPLDWIEGVVRAKRPRRLPVVLTRVEVAQESRNV